MYSTYRFTPPFDLPVINLIFSILTALFVFNIYDGIYATTEYTSLTVISTTIIGWYTMLGIVNMYYEYMYAKQYMLREANRNELSRITNNAENNQIIADLKTEQIQINDSLMKINNIIEKIGTVCLISLCVCALYFIHFGMLVLLANCKSCAQHTTLYTTLNWYGFATQLNPLKELTMLKLIIFVIPTYMLQGLFLGIMAPIIYPIYLIVTFVTLNMILGICMIIAFVFVFIKVDVIHYVAYGVTTLYNKIKYVSRYRDDVDADV